jgi:hypothetical protein
LNRKTIGLIWVAGILVMLVLYAAGPLNFFAAFRVVLFNFWHTVDVLIATVVREALDVVRAVAIGLYVVFVLLAIMARRNGYRTLGMLFGLSVLFLLLVDTDWYEPGTKWVTAALLAGAGAAFMTSRLLHPRPDSFESRPKWSARPYSRDGGPA